jgi:hypothetical protein
VDPSPPSTGQTLEFSTPAIKSSPKSSIDLTKLPEDECSPAQPKREELGHFDSSQNIVSSQPQNEEGGEHIRSPAREHMEDVRASETSVAPHRTSLAPSHLSSRSTPTQGANALASQRGESRDRDASVSSGLVNDFLEKVDEYIKGHVEVYFVAADGSIPRKRPLNLCNNIPRLFSQAKLAFNWIRTAGRILLVKIPGVESPCAIVEGDKLGFEDFFVVLKDARNWHRRRRMEST